MVLEAADAVRAQAREQGFVERHAFVMDARSDWQPVFNNMNANSLFGDKPLIEITLPTGKPGRIGGQAIESIVKTIGSAPAHDVMIVFKLPVSDRQTQNTAWYKALRAQAHFVACPSIGRRQLPDWIAQRLGQQQQNIDAEGLAWMAEHVEGNLLAAHQEILKLGLLYPEGHIDTAAVQNAVMNVTRFDINDLREATVQGDSARLLRILNGLKAEGQALPLVVWALTDDLIQLDALLQSVENGTPRDQAVRNLRLFGIRQQNVFTLERRLNAQQVSRLLEHAHEIDRLIKGFATHGRLNDAWAELERLGLRISQSRKR